MGATPPRCCRVSFGVRCCGCCCLSLGVRCCLGSGLSQFLWLFLGKRDRSPSTCWGFWGLWGLWSDPSLSSLSRSGVAIGKQAKIKTPEGATPAVLLKGKIDIKGQSSILQHIFWKLLVILEVSLPGQLPRWIHWTCDM